jgi:PAS domain S-box-containing protein
MLACGSAAQAGDDVFRRCDGMPFPVKYSVQPVVVHGRMKGAVISMTDIASRKRAEESLRKSDEWLGLAQRAAGVGIFDADLKTGETRVSEGQFLIYGLDPAGKWLSHEEWLKRIHPEDRDRMDRRLKLALSGTQFPGTEFRIVWPDGSIHWLLSQLQVFFDEAGTATREVGVNVDVTSRVRAEAVLNQFFSASATPMAIWGFDGRIRQVNPAWEPILGFTAAEVEGIQILDRLHPEDRAPAAVEFERLLISGGRTGFECRARCKDGSYRWLLLDAAAQKDVQAIYVTAHDITKRKRAEEALRESEAKFRELFDCAPVAYHELDMDGVVRRVNRAECALLGYEAGEMLGRPIWEFIAGTEREASREVFRRKLSGEQPLKPHQRRYVRRDGGELLIEIHDTRVCNATGEPDGIRTSLLDITEHKRMTEALKLSVEKLARSNEELERFAYVASHDLQEPLRMVASFTQLLAKRYSGQLDETADRYIHYAVDGAKRMQQLIADLLAYSRVNNKELDLRQTGCEAVVLEAMRNLQVAIDESGASIDWDPLPALWVDQGQLTQVFQNLFANAIKFRQKKECPRIHISAVDSGAEWLISVKDNGIGIDARHAERVFQMFQRLHTRAEYPGTGIGLAVCKKVIERHGGKLWVESEPGAGSTFRFTIPKPERNAMGGESANQTSRDSVD